MTDPDQVERALAMQEGSVLANEVLRLREVEQRVQRLLAECDRNEAHIQANVPHLPPDGGSFSVHVIRRFLRDASDRATPGGA